MGTINAANPKVDPTVKIFDEFYNYAIQVPVQEYEVVYSYFRSVFGTADAAGNFSVTLFRVASESGIPAMSLLQQFQGKSQPEITITLAYYLNNLRSPATLLGLNSPVTPNFYAARNIRS